MAYEPTNWQDGDIVTANKLNKIEQGITNGGSLLVRGSSETGALDKTWQEIYDALANGTIVTIVDTGEDNVMMGFICGAAAMNPNYILVGLACTGEFQSIMFKADSPTSYPVMSQSDGSGSDDSGSGDLNDGR